MEIFATLVIIAVLIQAIVEAVKGALCHWDYLALVLGAVLCPLAQVDAFQMAGVPLFVPYVGSILTGVIAGRGAAFVFDIIKRIKSGGALEAVPFEPPDAPEKLD